MADTLRVIIADDHPLMREGVASALAAGGDIEIVGQGGSAHDAIALAREHLPDLALVDLAMPGGGLNAVRAIATACPVTKIVVLTVSEDEDDVLAALQAGARAYVLKGVGAGELTSILRGVVAGDVYVTPTLAAGLLAGIVAGAVDPSPPDPLSELSSREREILEHVANGDSNREIANNLALSEKTVKHYMTNILQKLQVRNRVEAALLAQRAAQSLE
jgi:DNA-binding NarL/FixJ family response regulator